MHNVELVNKCYEQDSLHDPVEASIITSLRNGQSMKSSNFIQGVIMQIEYNRGVVFYRFKKKKRAYSSIDSNEFSFLVLPLASLNG